MSDKKYLFSIANKQFYSDMTYRCSHWETGDYSDWHIANGGFYFHHRWGSDPTRKIEWKYGQEMEAKDIKELSRLWEEYNTLQMEEIFGLED
jgi:hypothetical protein